MKECDPNGVLLQFVKLQRLPKDFFLGVDEFMTELFWRRGLLVINALKASFFLDCNILRSESIRWSEALEILSAKWNAWPRPSDYN